MPASLVKQILGAQLVDLFVQNNRPYYHSQCDDQESSPAAVLRQLESLNVTGGR
jgi:hypothetical protein